jgi:curved DNA-binding protein CbpA
MDMPRREIHDHPDWYGVLGVEPSATFFEIRVAYRRQTLALHADRLRSTEKPDALARAYDKLNELGRAYRTLRNPETRRAYDLAREGTSIAVPEPVRKGRPAPRRYATRPKKPGRPRKNRRRLGRIAVVVGFGLLVLWAVLTTIAERREAAASVRTSPPALATTPVP